MTPLLSSLPPELVSLIHHVELSKAGWWERGIKHMTIGVLWLLGGESTISEVKAAFRDQLGIQLNATMIEEHLRELASKGTVVSIPPSRFKLAERTLKKLDADLKTEEANAATACAKFEAQVAENCSELNPADAWHKFNERLLIPLIRDIGAKTYELLSSVARNLDVAPQFSVFLEGFDPACRDRLRNAVISFLDPKDVAVRTYILSHLNAYFFVEAGNLSTTTLSRIQNLATKPPRFTLFIDTNVLFSVLGFHDNPSNEAAESLIRLTSELSGRVPCKLYAYPLTIDEITSVFDARTNSFKGRPITLAMAEAALGVGLSGVDQKLAEEIIRTKGRVTPEAFFQPYRTGLVQILRSKGIEPFNVDVAKFTMRQDVIDNILDRQNFERTKYKERAKTYEQLKHDIVLWHLVKERRPTTLNLPLEAGNWVVTVDYRLLGFDAYKRQYSPSKIPVCIHPSALVQMFQFWVPRTSQFEEAMLGALRLPLLFHDFDPEVEAITIRILEGIARFEDATDISAETATAILTNDVLRSRLAGIHNVSEGIELIKSAMIEHSEEMRLSLEATKEKARELQDSVTEKDQAIVGLQSDLRQLKKEADRNLTESGRRYAALEGQLSDVQESLAEERRARAAEASRAAHRTSKLRFVVLAVAALIVLSGASAAVWWWLQSPHFTVVAVCTTLLLWVWTFDRLGKRRPGFSDWIWFDRFERVRKLVYGVPATIASALLGEWALRSFTSYWQ